MDVLERLEAATGPDREIDAALFAAYGEAPKRLRDMDGLKMWAEGESVFWKGGTVTQGPVFPNGNNYPRYTSSIDDALTLIPQGWWARLEIKGAYHHAELEYVGPNEIDGPDDVHSRNRPTMALAICTAALLTPRVAMTLVMAG